MSLPNTVLSKAVLEDVSPRILPTLDASVGIRSQSRPSLPTRIAVVGNYLPRQCGIATFTTDLCAAISAEYGTARLLALPVNDTRSWAMTILRGSDGRSPRTICVRIRKRLSS